MSSFGDIRQRVGLEINAVGADTVSVLAQATRELQANFKAMVGEFDAGKITANQMIAELGRMATSLNKIGEISTADADRMAKATASTQAFIEKSNVALQKKDSEEAKLDQAAQKRLDDRAAKDKATLDAIGEAADKASKVTQKAADDMAKANARAAEESALAAEKIRKAFEATVISVEQLSNSARQLKSDQISRVLDEDAAAALRAANAARQLTDAEEKELDELHQLNQAIQANTTSTGEQMKALLGMNSALDASAPKAARGKGEFGGFATKAEEAADKTKKFGYAAMNASYLVQDMQYGIGAVANNIGLMTQSLSNAFPKLDSFITKIGVPGGATGLGAGIMLAAVGFDVLYKNWDTISQAFGAGLPPKLMGDIKALEEELKLLQDKKYKTSVDYADIRIAQKETERLTELEAAYQRLKSGKTKAQQRQSEVVSEAIIEGGGTGDYATGAENVAAAVKQVRGNIKSATMIQLEDELRKGEELAEAMRKAGADTEAQDQKVVAMIQKVVDQRVVDEENRSKQARDIVAGAAGGNTQNLAELTRLFRSNPQAFVDRGVDESRLGAGLEMAAPENLFEPERRERRKKEQERLNDYTKERAAEAEAVRSKQATNDDEQAKRAATAIFPGVDDQLIDQIGDEITGGGTPASGVAKQRGRIKGIVQGRGVRDGIIDAVVDKILEKASDKAQNLILEGKMSPKDIAERKKNKKQGDELDREVTQNANRLAPGFNASLTRAAEERYAMGQDAGQITAALIPQLANREGIRNLDPKLRDAVAKEIVSKMMDKLANRMQAAQEAGGGGDAQIAMGMLRDAGAKFDQAQLAHLRTLANQEKMAGEFGINSMLLRQIEMRQRNVENVMGRRRGQPRFNNAKR